MRLALLALALLAPLAGAAQDHRLLPADDPAYRWVERLQRRGHLLGLNPTVAPYTEGEVRDALGRLGRLSPAEKRWARRLRQRLRPHVEAGRRAAFVAEVAGGAVASTNDRLDVLRYVEGGSPVVGTDAVGVYPAATLGAALEAGPLVAQLGARFDTYYEDDPDGLDVANKSVFLRNEGSYVGAVGRYGEVRLGRVARRWAGPAEDALFVSDTPRPYDALAVRVGGGQIAVRSFLAELDAADLDGRFTGRTGDRSREPSLRRYLAAHRIDWRPSRKVVVTGLESMMISGNGASAPLAALLPTAVYSFLNDGPPKNNEHNGLLGGHLWFQVGRTTVSGQVLFDDFDLFFGAEPASAAISGSVVQAGVADWADAGFALTAVTARTYNTGLPEQGYVYALRGIGLPFSDYVHARAFADLYLDGLVPGLSVRPEGHALWQGEADFREPFPDNAVPLILVGDAERVLRAGAVLHLQPSPWWFARADLGVNWSENDGFERGADAVRFVGIVEAGARVRLGASAALDW
jgi:hypothetical protein